MKALLIARLCLVAMILFPLSTLCQNFPLDSIGRLSQAEQVLAYSFIAESNRNSHSDTALYFAKRAFEIAEKNDRVFSKIISRIALGSVLHVRGSYDLSRKYYQEALDLSINQKNDSLQAVAHNGIGASHWQQGRHAEALGQHFKSLRIRDRINDMRGRIVARNSIGIVYQSQEKLPLAEKYVREAFQLLNEFDDPSLKMTTMHTLANIYGMQGKIKDAFAIDQEGLQLAEKTKNELAKSLFYDNMGNCYLYGDPPDYEKAVEYFTRTLRIDSAFNNKKQMSDSYANLGGVFFHQKKFADAIPYLLRCIQLANESGYVQGKLKALQMLTTAYRQSGRDDQAYDALRDAMRVKDSLVNISSENRIAEMQTLYETEKKQQQIDLQKAEISKKNYIITGTIIVTILLGLLALSGWLRYRLRQKSRLQKEIMMQQEMAARAILEAEEDERQRIARDLHDGVGQMMSATKMNLSAFESDLQFKDEGQRRSFEKIVNLVDESCREIRSVSHNMMPNSLLKNNLDAAVRDFIDKLDKKSLNIEVYTEGLEEKLDSNIEVVLYRIIQECVNNVIRHARATRLDISLIREKEGISATIEDNGRGFDTSNIEQAEGIGLKNIFTRVGYLKGTVDFDSAPGRGTVVALFIPIES